VARRDAGSDHGRASVLARPVQFCPVKSRVIVDVSASADA
jgi:hypothetical protein